MQLEMFAKVINIVICLVGASFVAFGVVRMVQMSLSPLIEGKLIDITQEYTSRGFMRRAKIMYSYNGKEYIYITSAKTFKRHIGEAVGIRVNKKGRVVELGQSIEFLVIGALMLTSALIFFTMI